MEEKYYEILRHHVNPNDCATVVKQLLSLHNVVGQSEQLVCDDKCEWTRYPKNGIWYDGCVKCGKEVAN